MSPFYGPPKDPDLEELEPTQLYATFEVVLFDESLLAAVEETGPGKAYPDEAALVQRCIAHGLRELGHRELGDGWVQVRLVQQGSDLWPAWGALEAKVWTGEVRHA